LAEIVPVVSEALEAQVRELLPSQRGFGEDLQASNVITPIIDLTAAAEGTTTPQLLQTALAFGSNTEFEVVNTTTNIATTPGFYRVVGGASVEAAAGLTQGVRLRITDGTTTKTLWGLRQVGQSGAQFQEVGEFDLVVFLRAGDTLSLTSDVSSSIVTGSIRQIADVNGTLVNPVGFTPQ
jgi:hypothetical protein